jgi:hypothetical protein
LIDAIITDQAIFERTGVTEEKIAEIDALHNVLPEPSPTSIQALAYQCAQVLG